jgi:hypothetical protein
MPEQVNARVLRVIGMARSGNHAIIDWILAQLSGRFCFLNCTEPGQSPFASARELADGRRHIANHPVDMEAEREGRHAPRDTLLYSHEDVFLGPVGRWPVDRGVGSARRRLNILILRDPFNLFASRFKAGFAQVSHLTALRIWKQHAREALRPRHLKDELVVVRFNAWACDPHYRATLAQRLGLGGASDIDQVARCAGGSSFDGLRYDGQASRMRVLERWRHYRGDPSYLGLFDAQTVALSEQLFGEIPGTAALSELALAG